jgi:hypothetical protein
MTHDIFLSYSTANSDWAEGVCQLLESDGHTVWMAPRDIAPGSTWGAEIVRGINDARLMLLLLSSASNHSRQVAREVQLADSAQLPIIPVLLEAIKPEGDFLYFLGNTQWLTALGGSPQTHAATLLAAVRPELAKPANRRTPSPAPPADISTDMPATTPHTDAPPSHPVVTGDSGAAARRAPIAASQEISPPRTTVAAPEHTPSATASKGPWLWVALGVVVVVVALFFVLRRQPTATTPSPNPTQELAATTPAPGQQPAATPPTQQPAPIAFNNAAPWTGTYEGNVAKDQVVVHISEESSSGHHEFQITVDNAANGKQGEPAIAIELGQDGKLTFSMGKAAAPRARCTVELASDKQSLSGEWLQLKTNRALQVDFKRTSPQP